jgi:hypothetical protein
MAAEKAPLVYTFTGDGYEFTNPLWTIRIRIMRAGWHEKAEVYVTWLGEPDADHEFDREGGERQYDLPNPQDPRLWQWLLQSLDSERPGLPWLKILEPARVALAPSLPPLTLVQGHKRQYLTVDDLEAQPDLQYLIDDHVPLGGFAVVYGPAGTGKTFIALDMALSIASGQKWNGHAVRGGPVVYVTPEGKGGLKQRVRAWRSRPDRADCDLAGMKFLPEAVNLMDERSVSSFLADLAEMDLPPALVVFDTLARSLVGGDENAARDMGLLVASVDRIREATGGTVMVVHHTGKSGDTERGSSALRAAADTMISVSADDAVMKLACDKQKDAEEFSAIHLVRVPTGESCFVAPMTMAVNGGLTPKARAILEELTATFAATGATPAQMIRVTNLPERTVYRSLKSLVDLGLAHSKGNGRTTRYYGGTT